MITFNNGNRPTLNTAFNLISEYHNINDLIKIDDVVLTYNNFADYCIRYSWTYIVVVDGRFAGLVSFLNIEADQAEIHFVNMPYISALQCYRIAKHIIQEMTTLNILVGYNINKNIVRLAKLLGFKEESKNKYVYRR